MAKRSDFAQKLLDDLRARKERMAASQSSKNSKQIVADACSYSKQAYRGPREMKTHQTSGSRFGTMPNRNAGGNKSFSIGEASKEMVALGRGGNSAQFGDLSMALAFALENGGKLRRMDSSGNGSVLGFLNQIGRQSVGMSGMGRSTVDRHGPANNLFPTLSHLHIKEISKGAQKLNQILRACSNGLNFDRCSIEIGKELLKGAMDLEESLRMLVYLQEASEYTVSPQNKTRITLLDEDEDEDTVKTIDNKQLARPVFSFDKPSRNSHYIQEAARSDLKQRLKALSYQSEAANFSHDARRLNTTNLSSHIRSASYSPIMKNSEAFIEQKNLSGSSVSKPEKARIPNVIAKLMGLGELPENDASKNTTKKECDAREKKEQKVTKKTAERSTAHERKTKDAGSLASPIRTPKQIQSNQFHVTQDMTHGLQAERNLASYQARSEGIIYAEKRPQKNVEETKPTRRKANLKLDKQPSTRNQSSQSKVSRKDTQEKEKKQDNAKLKDQKGKEKGETKELLLKHHLQQMALQKQKGSEVAMTLKWQAECNPITSTTERRDAHKLPSNNTVESLDNSAIHQAQIPQNFESEKQYAGDNEQQSVKKIIQVGRQRGNQSTSFPKFPEDNINSVQRHSHPNHQTPGNECSTASVGTNQSVRVPSKMHHINVFHDMSFPTTNDNQKNLEVKNSSHNSSTKTVNTEPEKGKIRSITSPDMKEGNVHMPYAQKAKIPKVQKPEAPRKIDELAARRSGNPHNLSRKMKNQKRRQQKHGQFKEEEQVRSSRSAEAHILKSNISVPSIPSIQVSSVLEESEPGTGISNMLEELESRAEHPSNFCSPPADDGCLNIGVPEVPASNKNFLRMVSNQQGQEPELVICQFSSHSNVSDPPDGSHVLQLRNKKASIQPLTESQNHLKQILTKSQLFLNTAEALFKLNIPLDTLNADSAPVCQDEESKLLLDCGYEVTKRKGKRQELSVHPHVKISTTFAKVRSLDDLIRQVHGDFEKLKLYGRNGKSESTIDEYLPKMLEIDVYDKDPDVNCMWDFGWHELMFTPIEQDDVVRDVEKHLLNGLLDEVIRDFLLIFSST